MRTWDDYKEHVKNVDVEAKKDIEEAESLAEIVGAMIRQRNSLGISQRELAAMCNMPQSSIARIESLKTTPNLDTILKLFEPLGLALSVSVKRI
jgi:ribosome-binding protein aMBF1 (putative translation factor)